MSVTVDMSQFYQVFSQAAAEQLSDLKRMLCDFDLGRINDSQMNEIFRAAHSINSVAGSFGSHDLAQVTHEHETLLDGVRKDELATVPRVVDVLPEAGDLLRYPVTAHRGSVEADFQRVAKVCEGLSALYPDAIAPAKNMERAVEAPACRFSFLRSPDGTDLADVIDSPSNEASSVGGRLIDLSTAVGEAGGLFDDASYGLFEPLAVPEPSETPLTRAGVRATRAHLIPKGRSGCSEPRHHPPQRLRIARRAGRRAGTGADEEAWEEF